MLIEREKRGLKNGAKWKDGISVFKWWMEDENCEGQLRMDIDGRIYEEYSGEDPYFW